MIPLYKGGTGQCSFMMGGSYRKGSVWALVWRGHVQKKTYMSLPRYLCFGALLCRDCGYRFSIGHIVSKSERTIVSRRQVCGLLTRRLENLTKVETQQEPAQREGTSQAADVKGRIVQFLWHLERENRSKRTIDCSGKFLNILTRIGADLLDPDSVKEKVAKQTLWKENTKRMASAVYKSFAVFNGIPFTPPKYIINQKLPFIPTEQEIDSLIVASPKRLATILQLLKEIPIRIGEALALKWTDIDFEHNGIYVNTTEKNGKPRAFKISTKLVNMLNALPRKNERVFGKTTYTFMETQFTNTRKRLATKLQNPRLIQIRLHTLRHWKATMEYHRTKDILYIIRMLGHKDIESTLVYTQLINFESDEYHSAVAQTVDEARKLLEGGFEYICQKDNFMLFRKRK